MKSPDRAEAIMLAFATPGLGWRTLSYAADVEETAGSQLREALPFELKREDVLTCAECAYFQPASARLGQCTLRAFMVAPGERSCEWHEPA